MHSSRSAKIGSIGQTLVAIVVKDEDVEDVEVFIEQMKSEYAECIATYAGQEFHFRELYNQARRGDKKEKGSFPITTQKFVEIAEKFVDFIQRKGIKIITLSELDLSQLQNPNKVDVLNALINLARQKFEISRVVCDECQQLRKLHAPENGIFMEDSIDCQGLQLADAVAWLINRHRAIVDKLFDKRSIGIKILRLLETSPKAKQAREEAGKIIGSFGEMDAASMVDSNKSNAYNPPKNKQHKKKKAAMLPYSFLKYKGLNEQDVYSLHNAFSKLHILGKRVYRLSVVQVGQTIVPRDPSSLDEIIESQTEIPT